MLPGETLLVKVMSFALTAAAHRAYLDTLNGRVPPESGAYPFSPGIADIS